MLCGLIKVLYQKDYYLQIDFNGDIPEVNRSNNIIKTKGLLRKIEPLRFQFIGSFNHPKKTQIFFHPNYNWNNYDKSLLGLTIYNQILPANGFSYKFSPLYSIGENTLAGNLNLSYKKHNPNLFIHKFKIGFSSEKYSHEYNPSNQTQYTRIAPYMEIGFTKNNARSKKESFIQSGFIHLDKGYETLNFINTKRKSNLSKNSSNIKLKNGYKYYLE